MILESVTAAPNSIWPAPNSIWPAPDESAATLFSSGIRAMLMKVVGWSQSMLCSLSRTLG